MLVGLLAIGYLSFLQTSLDIALTSPIGVVGCGEDQERGYMQTILLSMTVMEGGSVMVWGGISWDGRTDLCVLHCGALTAQRFRDDILDVHVRPYAGAIGDPFILMGDKARTHIAHAIQEYLEREGIERLD